MLVINEKGRDGRALLVPGHRVGFWDLGFIPHFSLIHHSQVASCVSYLSFLPEKVDKPRPGDRNAPARAVTGTAHTQKGHYISQHLPTVFNLVAIFRLCNENFTHLEEYRP